MKRRWEWMGIIAVLGLTTAVWLLSGLFRAPARAIPPQPAVFWGNIQMDGQNIPAGSPITAFVYDGTAPVECGHAAVQMQDGQSVYTIAVNGDDPDTPAKDGAQDGETVYFWVDILGERRQAQQSGVWHSAATSRLDLTIVGPPATATPSPTATATPTHTPTPSATPFPGGRKVFLPLLTKLPPLSGPLTVVTFQEGSGGYAGVRDATLDAWAPSSNFGGEGSLRVHAYDVRSALLMFDLSTIPRRAQVVEARLELYAAGRTAEAPLQIGVYRVKQNWSEEDANWLWADALQAWQEAGCNGPMDREQSPLSMVQATRAGWWYAWDVTLFVQDWVQFPESNAGVLLHTPSSSDWVEYQFSSSEASNPSLHPRLTVAYRVAAP
ncbi:MAG: DNRLRE domain-containing protein [Anaerolineae bacterium]